MISLDTFALLKSIGSAPKAFAAVSADLEKVAVASVKKVLKAKTLTVGHAREICQALGADTFAFILGHESMKDSDISGLVKQLDKEWPSLKAAKIAEKRDHLLALSTGRTDPSQKAAAATKAAPVDREGVLTCFYPAVGHRVHDLQRLYGPERESRLDNEQAVKQTGSAANRAEQQDALSQAPV